MLAAIPYEPLVRIHLGPLAVSLHGIFTAVGFLAGARLLLGDTRRFGIPDDDMYAILTRAGIGALVGGLVVMLACALLARRRRRPDLPREATAPSVPAAERESAAVGP